MTLRTFLMQTPTRRTRPRSRATSRTPSFPSDEGYKLPIGVGHASDYNGYTVSYREYMAYDHYRKALTAYGPHTADYMNTILMELARELNTENSDHVYNLETQDDVRAEADEARQVSMDDALGQTSSRLYDNWRAELPDDVGPEEATEPAPGHQAIRLDDVLLAWRVERGRQPHRARSSGSPKRRMTGFDFADQSGEIQTRLAFPEGINGFAQTYADNQEWIWTANFEAFNAFPAEIGSTPAGHLPLRRRRRDPSGWRRQEVLVAVRSLQGLTLGWTQCPRPAHR